MPVDDRREVETGRERPVDGTPVAEARGEKGVGDRRIAVPHEERALERERQPLDHAPRPAFEAVRLGQLGADPRDGSVELRRELDLREECLERRRLLLDRAQDVERVYVPRALPDRVERAFAEEARQLRLLDVAVSAQALERLRDKRRRPLADPELRDRGRQPPERVVALVVRAREAQRPSPSPLPIRRTDRRARSASVAARRAVARTPSGARRDASPPRPRGASAPPSRARSRDVCGRPFR